MGQKIPQTIEPKSNLIQNWLPYPNEPNVLIHKVTHEQVQRHIIKILIKDLPREISHFASRMSNHQPQICRLLYFHPTVPDSRMSHDQRQFREMHLYTDKMLPLKYWNKENLIMALNGLRKLVSIHGPIKITQNMICQNENGQVKVWISENPVNNYPDSKYMSQEQTVANLGAILAKKNKQIAGLLFGCNTLKDALDKISRNKREVNNGLNNYSHKATESGDFQLKKVDFVEKAPNSKQYRNVFGQKSQLKNTNSKQLFKNVLKKPQEDKPVSHLSYAPKAASPVQTFFHGSTINESSGNNKQVNQTELKKVKKKEDFVNHKSTTNLQFANIHRSISKNDPSNRNTFQERPTNLDKFQNNRFSKDQEHYASQKGLKNNSWQPYEHQNTFGSPNRKQTTNNQTKFSDSNNTTNNGNKTPNNGQNSGKKPQDITIINNNVSNYINTVVHNHSHVLKIDKKSSLNYPHEQRQSHDPLHSSHKPFKKEQKQEQTSNTQQTKEKAHFVPIFIQQKKRVNTNIKSSSPPERYIDKMCEGDGFLTRQDTMKSEHTNLSSLIESPTNNLIFDKKQEIKIKRPTDFDPRLLERKSQKVYTFSKGNQQNSSLHKFYNPVKTQNREFYPSTPPYISTGQQYSFNKCDKSFQNRFIKGQLRTKTTDFHLKTPVQQNAGNRTPKQSMPARQKDIQAFDIHIRISPAEEQEQAKQSPRQIVRQEGRRSHTPQQRSDIKKQIKKQFSFLLGGDSPRKTLEVQEKSPKLMKRSEIVEMKRSMEDVTQKIAKKQIQFAELKKMAQELLI